MGLVVKSSMEKYRDSGSHSSGGNLEMSNPSGNAGEVIEIPLLLPSWQVSALETAAHDVGLTAGEMVRHLLRDFISRLPSAC